MAKKNTDEIIDAIEVSDEEIENIDPAELKQGAVTKAGKKIMSLGEKIDDWNQRHPKISKWLHFGVGVGVGAVGTGLYAHYKATSIEAAPEYEFDETDDQIKTYDIPEYQTESVNDGQNTD